MSWLKNTKWYSHLGYVLFAASLVALVLVLYSSGKAQTVTPTPNVVDPAKPQAVVLTVKNANESIDTDVIKNANSVTVGGQPATSFQRDEQNGIITIIPPPNLSGQQPIKILDAAGKAIGGEAQLEYRSAAAPNASPAPTPDMDYVREFNAESRRNQISSHWWYYAVVIAVFLLVLGPFIVTISRGIWLSRATYRSPHGLPVGSFRSILAYSLMAFMGFYILTSLLTVTYFAPPDFLLGIVATVIGFYFGSRGDEAGGLDSKAGIVRGIVRKDKEPASGALVKFKTEDGSEPYSRITDVDGRFELRGAKPGKYKVSAALTGSPASDVKDITVAEGSDQEIEIIIKSASTAAQTGTVKGTVKKPDGATPAANAKVELLQGGVSKHDTKTGADGTYTIPGVAVGLYKVKASLAPDQPSDGSDVEVTAGGQQRIDLELK